MPPVIRISSSQNPRLKEAVRLRERRQRDKQRRFLVDGLREIQRGISAGIEPLEWFVAEELLEAPQVQTLLVRGAVYAISSELLSRLAFGERNEGIVLVATAPRPTLERIRLDENPLVALLVGLEKPGNVGAILRTADGAGVTATVIVDPVSDLYNPNTIRSSIGTVFTQQVATATTQETLAWLAANNVLPLAARLTAATDYRQMNLTGRLAIAVGSEANGLAPRWLDPQIPGIALPMQGTADSLNVSVTAAVLLYEALRQRSVGV